MDKQNRTRHTINILLLLSMRLIPPLNLLLHAFFTGTGTFFLMIVGAAPYRTSMDESSDESEYISMISSHRNHKYIDL